MPQPDHLIGTKVFRLTVEKFIDIEYKERKTGKNKRDIFYMYSCRCDCGNIVTVKSCHLTTKRPIKSCGCLRREEEKYSRRQLISIKNRKYSPMIASARSIWASIYKSDGLSFEQFYNMSQQNCFYCNSPPSNYFNYYKSQTSRSKPSQFMIEDIHLSGFWYNGLDRVDNSKGHILDNVVPCCRWCNLAKLNNTKEFFFEWLHKVHDFTIGRELNLQISFVDCFSIHEKYQHMSSAKIVWKSNYTDLPFDVFYNLSQLNCFYCNSPCENCFNVYKRSLPITLKSFKKRNFDDRCSAAYYKFNNGYYLYSGLDRVDSSKDHTIDNVVPCCIQCNKAKNNNAMDVFLKKVYMASLFLTTKGF
jgi:hypothetical protein